MTSLPSIKAKELLQALLKADFYIRHQRGSHARLFHHRNPVLRVTIPVHSKDVPEGTVRRIIKQSGLTDDEFLELLKR
jgi:predicted RNA binding protein YcfA (HicA-like mRNA interferase family)